MFSVNLSFPRSLWQLTLTVVAVAAMLGCGPTANAPNQNANPYDLAKAAFQGGDWEKALDLTDKLATATPPEATTGRARVLRAVIFTGQLKSAKALAEAYGKGAEKTKNPQFESEYRRLQHDNFESAAKAALNLAETAHQIAPGGAIASDLVLDANFPTTEGPAEVKALAHVVEGGWIESDQQDSAAADCLRKGVDDALSDAVGGDRTKARQALSSGPVKLEGGAFALFLSKELAVGGSVFDRHHARDPQKMIALCDEGDESLKAAQAALKATPNKDEEKQAKSLEDKFASIRKDK